MGIRISNQINSNFILRVNMSETAELIINTYTNIVDICVNIWQNSLKYGNIIGNKTIKSKRKVVKHNEKR